MKRAMLIGGFAALLILVGALVIHPERPPPATTDASSSNSRSGSPASPISNDEKARIREFWSVYRQAWSLKLKGSWQQAIENYERALELDPDHEDSLYGLANCYLEMNDFGQSLHVLQRLVEVNPMSLRGHLQIGMIRACPLAESAFDLDAAEASLQRAFEINQEESGSLLRLGEVALMKGDEELAWARFALANRSNFRAVEGYYLRAYLRWKQQRPRESCDLLAEAVRHSRIPKVVATVPAEGDTPPGSSLPPTTFAENLPLHRFWSDLAERYPDDRIESKGLSAEFSPLDTYLQNLRIQRVSISR